MPAKKTRPKIKVKAARKAPGAQLGVVAARNITERKHPGSAPPATQHYRRMFDDSIVGLFQTREDGRLLVANPALARIYGFDSLEDFMRTEPSLNRVHVSPVGWTEFLRLLNQRGAIWGFEAEHYRRDNTTIWVLESARFVRGRKGESRYVEGSVQSITDRKQAEEALRQLSGRLLLAQDQERRRIARELHDSTAQDMAAVVRNLHRIDRVRDLSRMMRATVSASIDLAEKATRDLRTLSYLLHPPLLDEAGLASALAWYVKGFSQRSGIQVELVLPTEFRRLPGEMETALFRIVQESLNNVHRHSGSRSARVELAVDNEGVLLQVRDVGSGIPPETLAKLRTWSAELGVGVAGMSERIRQLGGRLDIESGGRGTSVTAVLPSKR